MAPFPKDPGSETTLRHRSRPPIALTRPALPDLRLLVAHRIYARLAFAFQTELALAAQDPELESELLRARDCYAHLRAAVLQEGGAA